MIGVLIALIGCATDYQFEPAFDDHDPAPIETIEPVAMPEPPDEACPPAGDTLLWRSMAGAFETEAVVEAFHPEEPALDGDRWACFDRSGLNAIRKAWESGDGNAAIVGDLNASIEQLDDERAELLQLGRNRESQLQRVIDAHQRETWLARLGWTLVGLLLVTQ